MAYRQTRTLTKEEAAYIAGVIDGEGTISLSRRHSTDNRQLVISIASTERELLEYIRQAVGAGRITRKRTISSRHSPSVTFVIDNRQALSLLEQVAPYLHTYKAKRAELVLHDYLRLTPRNGKYSPKQQREREAFIDSFLNLRPPKNFLQPTEANRAVQAREKLSRLKLTEADIAKAVARARKH